MVDEVCILFSNSNSQENFVENANDCRSLYWRYVPKYGCNLNEMLERSYVYKDVLET